MALKLEPGTRLVVATHNPGKARELAEILENRFELVTRRRAGPGRARRNRDHLRRQCAAEGPRGGRGLRPGGAGRRFRPVGGGAGRLARHLFGALGRDPGRTSPWPWRRSRSGWRRPAPATSPPGSPARWPSPGRAGPPVVVEGRVDGTLTFPPRGDRGFGYDPIFMPRGPRPDLRRDGARGQGRHEPPRPRLRQAEGRALVTTAPPKLGVYIHWPYCARICPYCDFNVFKDRKRRRARGPGPRHRRRPGGAGGADRPARPGLDLPGRRHALADGPGLGGAR